jgi:hypothetical protein
MSSGNFSKEFYVHYYGVNRKKEAYGHEILHKNSGAPAAEAATVWRKYLAGKTL